MRRELALLALVVACGTGSPSVVAVHIVGGGCAGADIVGSGFVVSPGSVVTNAHVVAGAEELAVATPGGGAHPATVVAFDPVRDLAVLEVGNLMGEVDFGAGASGATGEILATGVDGELTAIEYTVRRSIIATGGDIYRQGDFERQAYELDADIDPGDSGAAAVDEDGRVIGVVFASSRERDSTTYAVAAAEVEAFLAEMPQGDPSVCR